MRVLDLFCGAGGSACGIKQAVPDCQITGVDIRPQPRYIGDTFVQADALTFPLDGFDFIWASPPCQHYSALHSRHQDRTYPDLVRPVREQLQAWGGPYAIENVVGAPLLDPVLLCGTMLGLRTESGELWRHRLFELSWRPLLLTPPCDHQARPIRCYGGGGLHSRTDGQRLKVIGVYGNTGGTEKRRPGGTPRSGIAERRAVMGIDWMNRNELSQAIPPAYSNYILTQWLQQRENVA